MLDTVRLAFALDAVTTRDWPDTVAHAVQHGYMLFAELLLRRSSIILPSQDEELMAWVLAAIRARLKLLERLCRCNLQN